MSKKIIFYLSLFLILFIVTGCIIKKEVRKVENTIEKSNNSIKIIINNKNYLLYLEDNNTVKSFIKMLPKEFDMNELNGNEKYVYLDDSLPTNSSSINHINRGDVMLYGDNCLVIFYKSFDTSYSYTKIGHINDLDDLNNENIKVKFEK